MSLLKLSCLAGLALVILLSVGWTPAAQEADQNDGFLLGACFKAQTLVDKAIADLQKVDRDISDDDRMIQKLEGIIAQARQKDNKQAESVARDALLKAQQAKKKNEETRAALELRRTRAVASLGAIRNRLASSSRDTGPKPLVKGLVSSFSGRVQVSKKSGEAFDLTADDVGLLEQGDTISTYGSSSAEIQTLEGRGAVQLGEYSELKLQEDTPEKQVLELVRGKIYSAVDKADDFANMLEEKTKQFGSDFQTVANVNEKECEAVIKSLRARAQKRFEVRTPSWAMAVRGTRFSVEIKNGETAEIAVFEGSVEAGDLKGEKRILVEEGFKVIMTKDGISEQQKIADIEKWWEK